MAHNRTDFRNILTRSLAVMALLCMYGFGLIGASALLLGASHALARRLARGGGGHGGGGFHGGGFRGGGFRGLVGFGVLAWALGLGIIPTATVDISPITATWAFAMWFGGAS